MTSPSNPEVAPEPTAAPDREDIFTDPALERRVEDPVVRFLRNNWRSAATIVAVVLAVLYIRDALQRSYVQSVREAADSFYKVRTEYAAYRDAQAKVIQAEKARDAEKTKAKVDAEAEKKAQDSLDQARKAAGESKERLSQFLAVLSDAREPYKQLAQIYRALLARESGDVTAMRTALAGFTPETLAERDASGRFFIELALLSLAKTLIDDQATFEEGRALLRSLAQRGTTVDVPAAVSLARIAAKPEEEAEALGIITDIQSAKPEQAALLDDEVKRLQ